MIVTDILWMAILFLIPGMASFTVYRHVAGYAIDKLYKFLFYSAIWAILDYGIVEVVAWIIYDIPFGRYLNVWFMFHYKFADISVSLMLLALLFGIIVAWGIGRFMRCVRLHYPGLLYIKLWDYHVNILCKNKQKVVVYDYRNGYKYVGVIKSFSYFTSRKEIVLQEPEIYSLSGSEEILQKKAEEIYLQLEDSSFSIVTLRKESEDEEEKSCQNGRLDLMGKSLKKIFIKIIGIGKRNEAV